MLHACKPMLCFGYGDGITTTKRLHSKPRTQAPPAKAEAAAAQLPAFGDASLPGVLGAAPAGGGEGAGVGVLQVDEAGAQLVTGVSSATPADDFEVLVKAGHLDRAMQGMQVRQGVLQCLLQGSGLVNPPHAFLLEEIRWGRHMMVGAGL